MYQHGQLTVAALHLVSLAPSPSLPSPSPQVTSQFELLLAAKSGLEKQVGEKQRQNNSLQVRDPRKHSGRAAWRNSARCVLDARLLPRAVLPAVTPSAPFHATQEKLALAYAELAQYVPEGDLFGDEYCGGEDGVLPGGDLL